MYIYQLLVYFFVYGFLGWCTEVAFASVKERRFVNRGFLNGPICPIYGVGVAAVAVLLTPLERNLVLLYLASVVLVTVIEGLTGYAMDKIFHHKWWDYSEMSLNIGGYVCLLFSLVWGAACVFIMKCIHPLVEGLVRIVLVPFGAALIAVLCIVLCIDLYVTSTGIFRLNRHLERMERIAAELHEISDRMGADIHENVMDVIEKLERLEDITEENRARLAELKERRGRIEELKKRYAELSRASARAGGRLMKAFPHMESRRHRRVLRELRKNIEEYWKKERKNRD